MEPKEVIIAGAGITGLGVALGLAEGGIASTILERRPQVGGLAAVWERDGQRLHPGIHLLHASADKFRPTVQRMAELMQPDCHVVGPTSALHFLDRYLAFPLRTRELALALGPLGMGKVVGSAAACRVATAIKRRQGHVPQDSFEAVVQEAFGDQFYRLFFRDYTAKVLGLDPTQIAGEWARRRVPMPSKRDALLRLFPFYRPKTVEHAHPNYPVGQLTGHNGLDSLFDGILARCGQRCAVKLQSEVQQIHVESGQVRMVRWGQPLDVAPLEGPKGPPGSQRRLGKSEQSGAPLPEQWSGQRPFVFSTIPLPDLVQRITPRPPSDVLNAAKALRFRGLVYVFVEVSRPRLHPSQWTYFQSPSLCFNRLSEFGNIVPGAFGPNRTLVCAEITAAPGDPYWTASDLALASLVRSDLISVVPGLNASEMGRCWVEREPHGYPIYDMEFQQNRGVVLDYIDRISGLVALGRQGRFDYLNMDECFQQGLDSALRFVPKD